MTLCVLQEEHREAKLTLRPPSLAAPYAPVQSWQHQPEKLIFESCGYEANVSCPCCPSLLAGTRAPVLFCTSQTPPAPREKGGLPARMGEGSWERKPFGLVPNWLGRPA